MNLFEEPLNIFGNGRNSNKSQSESKLRPRLRLILIYDKFEEEKLFASTDRGEKWEHKRSFRVDFSAKVRLRSFEVSQTLKNSKSLSESAPRTRLRRKLRLVDILGKVL